MASEVRREISRLMRLDEDANRPLADDLDAELANMDPNQGPLNVEQKAENADKIVKDRQRQLANVGFVAAMHPDAAKVLINTADTIACGKPPEGKESKKTYTSAHRFLQALFRYYSDEDETK